MVYRDKNRGMNVFSYFVQREQETTCWQRCDFFRNIYVKARNKRAIKIMARVSWLPSMSYIYCTSSLYLDSLLPVVVLTPKLTQKQMTWVVLELHKRWQRIGGEAKNWRTFALGISSSVLFIFSSTFLLLLTLVAAVADNGRRRLPQQPATATTS